MSNAPAETLRRVYFYIVKRKVALSGVKDRAEDYDIGLLGVSISRRGRRLMDQVFYMVFTVQT